MRTLLLSVPLLLCLHSYSQQIEVAAQKGHSGDIIACSFNHDGRLLASAGADNLIKLWHIPTGKEMASFISASAKPDAIYLQVSIQQPVELVEHTYHFFFIAASGKEATRLLGNAS